MPLQNIRPQQLEHSCMQTVSALQFGEDEGLTWHTAELAAHQHRMMHAWRCGAIHVCPSESSELSELAATKSASVACSNCNLSLRRKVICGIGTGFEGPENE